METAAETIGLYSRITLKVTNRAVSKTQFSLLRCLLLLLALLRVANGIIADSRVLVDQGQRAFQNGAFSQAAADWQKAVESVRGEESVAFARQTSNSLLTAQALCNAASTAARAGEYQKTDDLNTRAIQEINRLDSSHAKAFLLLTAGQTDRQIKLTDAQVAQRLSAQRLMLRSQQLFQQALELAEKISDHAIETYALGYLGQLYEQDGQPGAALAFTRRAAFAAQQAQMPEALYRWEWQTGRLLKTQDDTEPAIAAYRRAIQTLQPIRNDVSLGYGNGTARLSFREAEGPLFFELADLLLQQSKSAADPAKEQAFLLEARDTVEQLKAVELEDYFCDHCVDVQRSKARAIEAVDEQTAVVYLIPLATRTEVLVGLTSGLKRFTVDVGADALTEQEIGRAHV